MESSQTRNWTCVPCIGRWLLIHCTPREAQFCYFPGEFLQPSSTLCLPALLICGLAVWPARTHGIWESWQCALSEQCFCPALELLPSCTRRASSRELLFLQPKLWKSMEYSWSQPTSWSSARGLPGETSQGTVCQQSSHRAMNEKPMTGAVGNHWDQLGAGGACWGFPGGSAGKESACNAGDLGSLPGLGRSPTPGGGHGNPLQCSCLETPHGQRSLVGYSPRGRKRSGMTERLSPSTCYPCLCACSLSQSCLTLFDPMDRSPPRFSVHGISQARILEWVAISSSRGSSWPRDRICISWIGSWILHQWATWEAPYLLAVGADKYTWPARRISLPVILYKRTPAPDTKSFVGVSTGKAQVTHLCVSGRETGKVHIRCSQTL